MLSTKSLIDAANLAPDHIYLNAAFVGLHTAYIMCGSRLLEHAASIHCPSFHNLRPVLPGAFLFEKCNVK